MTEEQFTGFTEVFRQVLAQRPSLLASLTGAAASDRAEDDGTTLSSAQEKALRQVKPWDPEGTIRARDFLEQYERVAHTKRVTDLQIVSNIAIHFVGLASSWYSDLERADDPALYSWAKLKELILQSWDPRPTISTALANISGCRILPNETVQQHRLRFGHCVSDLNGELSPVQLKQQYLDMLRPATAEAIRQSRARELEANGPDAWTYTQVSQAAHEYELRQQRLSVDRLLPSVRPALSSSTNSTLTNEMRKRRFIQLASPSSASFSIPAEEPNGKPRWAPPIGLTCFNCGQKGHYASDCHAPRAESVPARPLPTVNRGPASGRTETEA